MATMDYVEIPSSATRLDSTSPSEVIRPAQKIMTSLPSPENTPVLSPSSPNPISPSKPGFNIQQVLLSSALPISSNITTTPRAAGKDAPRLLSARDALSIPITTVNFRRFVSKSGPLFWLQDRLEEIVMWRKGWIYTSVWIAAYAFICYFPRLFLLVPLVILLGVILATDPALKHASSEDHEAAAASLPLPPQAPATEGSVDWLANVQAIQNLMGAVADLNDVVLPFIPHLNHSSPYTPIIFTAILVFSMIFLPVINLLPIRITILSLGLFPFFLTHPITRETLLPAASMTVQPHLKRYRVMLTRYIDNDRLEDKHWNTEMREVELWENERWMPNPSSHADDSVQMITGWSKGNLKPGERRSWTRGRDGWSAIAEDGSGDVSNLTFSLSPGWLFVETEDWRPDLEGTWISNVGTDDSGWVYSNDAWMDPHPSPQDEWKTTSGMTRRRRWIRRIYYQPPS